MCTARNLLGIIQEFVAEPRECYGVLISTHNAEILIKAEEKIHLHLLEISL